jgi:hypothetical protein
VCTANKPSLGILQESWTLDDIEDELETFLQNGENRLLCSTMSNFRRRKFLSAFDFRGPIISYVGHFRSSAHCMFSL